MDLEEKWKARREERALKREARALPAWTREKMEETARERIEEISKEFKDGFSFLENYPKTVTFFGSNQFKEDNTYYQNARTLAGRIVTELGYSVVSGGGPGIMEAANRGAFEANGESLGLTIKLPHEQIINKFISHEVDSYYFFVRKVLLSFSSEAFIFFPGGYGTLDEFFEIITLLQTGKIVGTPLICVGKDYWKALERFMQAELLSRSTILPEDLLLYTITDDLDEVLRIIRETPIRVNLPFKGGINAKVEPVKE
ncbi:TIGR00730 family Rossman fold protein [Candidatus Parcubacteria bacterium]|nr:TIGR00730 family Rossman fold protein [Candidatus Parcubacteria bacterium]